MLRSICWLLCAVFASSCFGWNGRGHATIAALAEANLTPAALKEAQALLREDLDRYERPSGRTTLAAVASWADEIRDEAVKFDSAAYKGWHVRSNNICSDKLGACKNGHCVDQLIISNARILKDRTQPARARNEALKWVVHLVGDLHMPLHSGIGRNSGGAKVVLEGVELKPDASFHTVWDGELLNAAVKGWKSSARLGDSETPLPEEAPTQWMIEARDVARSEAYEPLPGFACESKLPEPLLLDLAYQQRTVAVVRTQVERAGLRLAQLLNQLLGE